MAAAEQRSQRGRELILFGRRLLFRDVLARDVPARLR